MPDEGQGSQTIVARTGKSRVLIAELAAIIDIVLFSPLFIAAAVYGVRPGDAFLWWLLLLIPAGLGAWMASYRKSAKSGVLEIAAAVVLGLGIGYGLAGQYPVATVILSTIAIVTVWLLSAQHYRTGTGITAVPVYMIGLLLQFVSLFFFHHLAKLEPFIPAVSVTGLIGMAVLYFSLNESRLNSLLLDKDVSKGLPNQVKHFNRVLVLGATVIIWLVFVIRVLQREAARLWWAVVHQITRLLVWLNGLFASHQTIPLKVPPKHPFKLPHSKQKPPVASAHSNLLGWIVLGVLLAAFLSLILWFIWKKLMPWMTSWYRKFMTVEDAKGYVDEEERLVPLREGRPRKKRRHSSRSRDWGAMTTKERIRFLYAKWLVQSVDHGYSFKPSLTAHETEVDVRQWRYSGPDEKQTSPVVTDEATVQKLIGMYDEARYGDGEIPDDAVETLRQSLNRPRT